MTSFFTTVVISLNFSWVPIDNRSALVQMMAFRIFDAKSLPEPKLVEITDAYTHHQRALLLTQINFDPSLDKW